MKIYTSYFGNRNIPDNLTKISIAGKPPDGYECKKYTKLAPQKDWWTIWKHFDLSEEWYIVQYNLNVLSKLTQQQVYDELVDLSNGEGVVLLCYEKPDKFCHRHLVREWLNNGHVNCEELNNIQEKEADEI